MRVAGLFTCYRPNPEDMHRCVLMAMPVSLSQMTDIPVKEEEQEHQQSGRLSSKSSEAFLRPETVLGESESTWMSFKEVELAKLLDCAKRPRKEA